VCAVALIAGASSLGVSAASAGSAKAPFLIGADESLSGVLAVYGGWVKAGFGGEFAAVNKTGGIDGHKLDLKVLDDQFTLATAIANMKQLLAEKPVFVTGGILTTFCAGLQPLVQKAKIPEDCFEATDGQLSPVKKLLFERNPPEALTAQPIITFIPSVVTATPKIGILVADIPGPDAFASEVQTLAQAKGWSITQSTTSPGSGTPPTDAQLAALAATDPNVIVTEIAASQNAALVEALRTDGFTGPVISQDPDYAGLSTLKDSNYYTLSPTTFVSPNSTAPAAKEYIADLKSQGVTGIQNLDAGYQAEAWVGAVDVVAALKKCTAAHAGNCTGLQLAAALDSTTVSLPGIVSKFGYTATDHVPFTSQYVYGYRASSGVTLIKGPLAMGNI
jgi:ABC-type branched-subunit amino acid transport system substrate-binding protein